MSTYTPRPLRGSVVTWRVPDFPNTPEGLCGQLCAIAEHCLEDAKKLDVLSHGWASPAEYILITHALELSLKALLAKHGLKEEELRNNFGHNLDKLFDTASSVDHGLDLLSSIPHAKRIITWVNEYHSRGDPIRHALPSPRTLAPWRDILQPYSSPRRHPIRWMTNVEGRTTFRPI